MKYSLGLYEKAMPDSLSFRELLIETRNAGFDRLEISIDESEMRQNRLYWTSTEKRNIRDLLDSEGVPVKTMCLSAHRGAPFGSHDPLVRKKAAEIMKRALELACEIGVCIIQLAGYDVYYEEHDKSTEQFFFDGLAEAVENASRMGILLGFETMETSFMDTVEKSMYYVNKINSPYLGLYPDIGNLQNASALYDIPPYEDIRKGKGHIFAGHLKETRPGVYRNLHFGEGHTDYFNSIRALLLQGVRMFTGEFWYLEEPEYRSSLKMASIFLRDKIEVASQSIILQHS